MGAPKKKLAFEVGEDYRVLGDAYCWSLEKRHYSQKSKSYSWKSVGYYANLRQLIAALVELELRVCPEVESAAKMLEKATELTEQCEKALEKAKKDICPIPTR